MPLKGVKPARCDRLPQHGEAAVFRSLSTFVQRFKSLLPFPFKLIDAFGVVQTGCET